MTTGILIGVAIGLVIAVVAAFVAFKFGISYRKKIAEAQIGSAEEKAKRIIADAQKAAESKKREALVEAKDEIHKNRVEYEKEVRERRNEISRQERRIQQKEETLDKKTEALEQKEEQLAKRNKELDVQKEELKKLKDTQIELLEKISGLTAEEAKEYLLKNIESEVRHETAMMIKEIEGQAKEEADKRAKNILGLAIQKCAADHVAETTVSVVPLPSEDMKGRIIGREGRNIRTLETLTGIDLIIDDKSEAKRS